MYTTDIGLPFLQQSRKTRLINSLNLSLLEKDFKNIRKIFHVFVKYLDSFFLLKIIPRTPSTLPPLPTCPLLAHSIHGSRLASTNETNEEKKKEEKKGKPAEGRTARQV